MGRHEVPHFGACEDSNGRAQTELGADESAVRTGRVGITATRPQLGEKCGSDDIMQFEEACSVIRYARRT